MKTYKGLPSGAAFRKSLNDEMVKRGLKPRGGYRPGAGSKPHDPSGAKRKNRSVFVTDDELRIIRVFLAGIRTQPVQSEWVES